MSENETEVIIKDEGHQLTFSDIINNQAIVQALADNSLTKPTPVQQKTIPIALSGKDVVAQAQTGSGKTLAFSVPLVSALLGSEEKLDTTLALVLTPTRELADQIHEVVCSISPNISPVCVIGGVDINKQIKNLEKDRRLVIGTPGRIMDLMRQKELSLQNCRYFVLDEADEMLSMGFIEDIRDILKKLPKKRQGMFVSATITPRVEMLARSFLPNAQQIIVETDDDLVPDIEHSYYEVGSDLMAKPAALSDLIETIRPESTIIFCNTKSDTTLVESLLRRRGFDARRINSDLNQSQRQRVMKKIRAKELSFLIATDIAARGIDIEEIELVVNYSIHEQPETYVHRTGRTGRAGKKGSAISLIGPRDFGSFHFLTKVLDTEFTKKDLPSDEEVSAARYQHLKEIIDSSKTEYKPRDKLIANSLLEEAGLSSENCNEKLIETIGRLARYVVEHHTSAESKSLEEELEAEGESSSKSNKSDDDRKSRKKSRSRDSEQADSSKTKPAQRTRHDELRLYIGKGSLDGLTVEAFLKLAKDNAQLEKKQIRNISLRERYAFVDVLEPDAQTILEKLNGAEIGEMTIPIEIATTISSKKPPRGRSSSRQNNKSSDRRDRSSRNKGNSGRSKR